MTKTLHCIAWLALGCVFGTANAEPIEVGGEVFDLGEHAFPSKVELRGYEVTSASISDSNTYLEGANTRGWQYGMTRNYEVTAVFQAPIEDQPGDDVYFGQGRMFETVPPTGDRHALEFSFDGLTWHYLGHADFTMASTYWYNTITHPTWYYQLHRSSIDLADYGVTGPITEVHVRGVELLNLVLVGNLNAGVEVDEYKPLVNLFPEAVSYIQGGVTHYNGYYKATIFAHDASGVWNNFLYQRVVGEPTWTRVDSDDNLSSTIGGYYGGHYRLVFDYSPYAAGTALQLLHITVDYAGRRTAIVKRAVVLPNGSLRFLD